MESDSIKFRFFKKWGEKRGEDCGKISDDAIMRGCNYAIVRFIASSAPSLSKHFPIMRGCAGAIMR